MGTEREGHACRVRQWNADAAHAQFWQRPMWLRRPEYRATPQSVFAKVQEFARPRVVGRDALLRDLMPTNMARHAKYPRRPRRVALRGGTAVALPRDRR